MKKDERQASTNNVKEIPLNRPDPEVIETLRDALKKAESGVMQSVVIISSNGRYETENVWGGMNKNNMAIVGEIEATKAEIIGCLVELRADET